MGFRIALYTSSLFSRDTCIILSSILWALVRMGPLHCPEHKSTRTSTSASFRTWRGVGWYLVTDVSGHPADPLIFDWPLKILPIYCPEMSITINLRSVTSQKIEDLNYTAKDARSTSSVRYSVQDGIIRCSPNLRGSACEKETGDWVVRGNMHKVKSILALCWLPSQ